MSLELETHVDAPPAATEAVGNLRRLDDGAALEALADEWNELAGAIPFRRYEWLGAWWRHFGAGRRLNVLLGRDAAGRLRGLVPLCTLPGSSRRWTSLGSGLACSDHQTLLARPGDERPIGAAAAAWLLGEGRRAWRSLALDGIAADDAAVDALARGVAGAGGRTASRQHTCCWRTRLPDTWDAFVMQFTKRRRTTVRQLQRRLFEESFAQIRLVETHDDLDEAWPLLVELHQKRQRSLGHAGCFRTPQFGAFLRDAAQRFLALGRLRLQWLTIGGRPAAAQLDLIGGDTQYHYLSGMEPELLTERPGRLGMLAMLHRAQGEGIRTYDFLRGDHRYKSDWLAEPTAVVEWRFAAPGWRGAIDLGLTTTQWRARRLAKRWLSRFRSH